VRDEIKAFVEKLPEVLENKRLLQNCRTHLENH
jgi:hypothetical protein